MQMKRMELTVGVFVVAGFLALGFLALRVSGMSVDPAVKTYKVSAYFDNVGGLTERAKVTIAGVVIGKVVGIQLDVDSFSAEVVMEIDSRYNTLTSDSTARILTAGLLGEKYIGISLGAEDTYLADQDEIFDTQSALVLEDLIAKFFVNSTK